MIYQRWFFPFNISNIWMVMEDGQSGDETSISGE
jgi:hypothetical protein